MDSEIILSAVIGFIITLFILAAITVCFVGDNR